MSRSAEVPEFITAFEAAAFLHEVFYDTMHGAFEVGDTELAQRVTSSGVHIVGPNLNPAGTQKLAVRGLVDRLPAEQILSKDRRGNFHFATLFTYYGGPLLQTTFTPEGTASHDPDSLYLVEHSLFMQAFRRL